MKNAAGQNIVHIVFVGDRNHNICVNKTDLVMYDQAHTPAELYNPRKITLEQFKQYVANEKQTRRILSCYIVAPVNPMARSIRPEWTLRSDH
jgi:hypothetical protein